MAFLVTRRLFTSKEFLPGLTDGSAEVEGTHAVLAPKLAFIARLIGWSSGDGDKAPID